MIPSTLRRNALPSPGESPSCSGFDVIDLIVRFNHVSDIFVRDLIYLFLGAPPPPPNYTPSQICVSN